jgi:uncharacterized protein YfaS (alpha-2-macroglobulin family)
MPNRFFFILSWVFVASLTGCGEDPPADALRVLDVAPGSSVDALDLPITVRFDKPVVPAAQVGKPLPSAPITLEPSVAVNAHWSDRQTLVIAPKAPLKASTRYRLIFGKTLATRVHEAKKERSFVAGPLRVTGMFGADATQAAPELSFRLHFTWPVKPSEVVARCALTRVNDAQSGDKKRVALKTTDGDKPETAVALASAERLEQGQAYVLGCEGLIAIGGDTAMEPYSQRIAIYPTLALLGLSPEGGSPPPDELELRITTTTPIDPDMLGKHVHLKPRVGGLEHAFMRDHERADTYKAILSLEAQTEYTLSVDAGLVDVFGQKLKDGMSVKFRTADAKPSLKVEAGIYTLEAHAKGYPLWSRNVDDLELQCAAIPKERVVALLTSGMSYDPWWDSSDVIDWGALKVKPITTALSTGKAKNKWTLSEIDLSTQCGKPSASKSGALYLAELRSNKTREVISQRGYGSYPHRVLANKTDLGVLLKMGPASGLVWVSKLSSAAPAQGAVVTLYDTQGKRVHAGVTDAQGLVRTPGSAALITRPKAHGEEEEHYRDQRLIAMIEHEGDFAVVDGNWQDGIQTWSFGVRPDTEGNKARIRGFIQSDRGIYRPGETAHFKGLVREVALGQTPRVPTGQKVFVRVDDSRGLNVFEKTLTLSAYGGFTFDIPLNEQAELGDWYVHARVAGQSFQESFSVEAIRPVSFEIRADQPEQVIRLHDKQAIGFTASYLFGAPVSGADASFTIERRKHHLRFEGFDAYSFDDYASNEESYHWYDDYDSSQQVIASGEVKTNAKGKLAVTLSEPDGKLDGAHDYVISVSVSDATQQTVSKQVAITAHARSHYLGVAPREWVQRADQPFGVGLVAIDPSGKRVQTDATLTLTRRTWDCGYRSGHGYRCERQERELSARPVSIAASGEVIETVSAKEPGELVLKLSGKDAQGKAVAASSTVWIVGEGQAYWGGEPSVRMELVANKKEYMAGETALLVARADIAGAKLLVTTEREGVRDAFVLEPKSSGEGISIPIEATYAPNMFVSVALIRGRRGEKPDEGPQFQLGMVELKVSSVDKRLQVALSTEKESYQPGERVRGSLRVTAGGAPVQSEVALSVADEGVLQLIGFKTPDPMLAFYAPMGLGVESATSWNRIAKLPDPNAEESEEGADGGQAQDRVRSRFVASALWLPMLMTDAQGNATFEFDAPDNLTAFRLMAAVADVADRFGSAEARMRIQKPLLLMPVVPRFFTQGDSIAVGAVVHNYTQQAGEVKVSASFAGLKAKQRQKSVKLEPNSSARVVFDVEVEKENAASIELQATMGEHRDAFRLALPITRPLVKDVEVLAQGKLEVGASFAIDWKSPDKNPLEPGESGIELTVDRTGLADLGPSLRYLVQYPYGCLEQTLSSFVPLLSVRELAKSLDLEELRGPKLERFVDVGLAKVLRHQREDGHFSLWPGGETYPHLTVYAAESLLLAKDAKLRVPEAALTRALEAMRSWANDAQRTLAPGGETATIAAAAYVLALAGQPDAGLSSRLFDARAALPLYGRALLLRALVRSKAPKEQIDMLLGETLLDLETDSGWSSDYDRWLYMSSPVRDQAIVLSALLDLDPGHARVEPMIAALKKARLSEGYWGNTQENAYALRALAQHASRAATGSATLRVLRGGKQLAKLELRGGQAKSFVSSQREIGDGEITLEPSGPVYFSLRQKRVREVSDNPPVARGFTIERSYVDLASRQPLDQAKPGQLVRVQLRVCAAEGARYVALVDPLPAGFEPVNSKLETERGATQGQDESMHGERYWDWTWSFTAQHDDRVYAFSDAMEDGCHDHAHVLRATSTGTFTAPPAHVEAMYEPARRGSTGPAIMRVAL